MGKFSVLLCDSDETYVKRLASGLQRQLKESVSINAVTNCKSIPLEEQQVDLLLTSQMPDISWRRQQENCICLWLDDGETEAVDGFVSTQKDTLWRQRIFKYQAVSQIGNELIRYVPNQRKISGLRSNANEQNWYGVVSPVRHEMMIPYAVTVASQLGAGGRVLMILMMEFSGICPLLGVMQTNGVEDFLLELRQTEEGCLEQVPMPHSCQLPGFDLMNVTDNPMILYELRGLDVQRLIERIRMCSQYDAVIWVAGNMIQGIGDLMSVSDKIFCIEKGDNYSLCCEKEFQRFVEGLEIETTKLVPLRLPVLKGIEPGEHLLLQWNQSQIGNVVRDQLKGGATNGLYDGNDAKSDFESDGY